MASDAKMRPDPLSFMTKISPWIAVYRPTDVTPSGNSETPKLVILLPWMLASSVHIAKYVRAYQSRYPGTCILLIRSGMKHVLWRPTMPSSDIVPAISVIRAALDPSQQIGSQVLIHTFSNGGSAMLCHLRASYGDDFPRHVAIYDSAPGRFHNSQMVNAGTAGMPPLIKLLVYPIAFLAAFIYWILYLGRADALTHFARSHNSIRSEAKRVYIYSEPDKLVGWKDIEKHAREATEKGYNVQLEKFDKTQHVSHIRSDEDRYWKIVQNAWQEGTNL